MEQGSALRVFSALSPFSGIFWGQRTELLLLQLKTNDLWGLVALKGTDVCLSPLAPACGLHGLLIRMLNLSSLSGLICTRGMIIAPYLINLGGLGGLLLCVTCRVAYLCV